MCIGGRSVARCRISGTTRADHRRPATTYRTASSVIHDVCRAFAVYAAQTCRLSFWPGQRLGALPAFHCCPDSRVDGIFDRTRKSPTTQDEIARHCLSEVNSLQVATFELDSETKERMPFRLRANFHTVELYFAIRDATIALDIVIGIAWRIYVES